MTTPRVRTIDISGFRTVHRLSLPLGPITALVGEANAGKSNVLAAISLALAGGDRPAWPVETDYAPAAGRIVIQATTTDGPVGISAGRDGARSRQGSWSVVLAPSDLRAGSIIGTTSDQPAAAMFAEALRRSATAPASPSRHAANLVAGLERCCDVGVTGLLVLVEEPELFLRPQAQRYLYRVLHRFAAAGNQVVYSTHAPAFLNVARLDELAVVTRDPTAGTRVTQHPALPPDAEFRAMSEYDAERGELFLADVAVLVEGRTEKLALPHVFRALGVDVDREGISIVECGGKSTLPVFVQLAAATGIPFLVVHDRDAPAGRSPNVSEARLNEALRALAGDDRVVELVPDFEGAAGLRKHKHKPEQAWRSVQNLTAADVPDALRRIVARALALRG